MLDKRFCLVLLLLLGLVPILVVPTTSLADSGNRRPQQAGSPVGPDISHAVLTPDDLPGSFEAISEDDLQEFATLAYDVADVLRGFTQVQLHASAIFCHQDPSQYEVLVCLLLSPLNQVQQVFLDHILSNPESVMASFGDRFGPSGDVTDVRSLTGIGALGHSRFAFTAVMEHDPFPLRVDAIIMRRRQAVAVLWTQYVAVKGSALDIGVLASKVDQRIAEAIRAQRAPYRPAGPLVPVLTTYIPTPVDISVAPEVVGANVTLAAVATILFVAVQELLNSALSQHEAAIQEALCRFNFLNRLGTARIQLPKFARDRARLIDAVGLAGIVALYGLIFSFLERRWNPFTVAGAYVFLVMTFACGMVRLCDDMAEWHTARRWGLHARLYVRKGNLVLAVASTLVSRILSLVPGIMLGVPEAFEVDSTSLDKGRERKLLFVGLRTLVLVGASVWLLSGVGTFVATFLPVLPLALSLSATVVYWIGGLQSVLLLAFAYAMQNIFLEMLGLHGTVGRALMDSNRGLWGLGMLSTAFMYHHTLLNPQGDLAMALATTNVRFFLATITAFTGLAAAVWLYFRIADRPSSRKTGIQQDD